LKLTEADKAGRRLRAVDRLVVGVLLAIIVGSIAALGWLLVVVQ
jgi:hypothetical protein